MGGAHTEVRMGGARAEALVGGAHAEAHMGGCTCRGTCGGFHLIYGCNRTCEKLENSKKTQKSECGGGDLYVK